LSGGGPGEGGRLTKVGTDRSVAEAIWKSWVAKKYSWTAVVRIRLKDPRSELEGNQIV